MRILPGGIKFKREGVPPPGHGGGVRGRITSFSTASQRRMMDTMMSVPWQDFSDAGSAFFVGLTWADGYKRDRDPAPALGVASASGYLPVDWAAEDVPRWHEQAKAFRRRLEWRYGDRLLAVLWKREFQHRGAPHYHLVIFFREGAAPEVGELQCWVARSWTEVAEPGNMDHLAHGSDVRAVRGRGSSVRALMRYLGKYMAKAVNGCVDPNGELLPIGRCWGVWGDLPAEVVAVIRYAWAEQVQLVRRLRRWGRESRYLSGLTAGRNGWRVWYDGYMLQALTAGLPGVT